MKEFVKKWHKIVAERDEAALEKLLHEDVVMYSPVVFTPQKGKEITTQYLKAALEVLVAPDAHFKYINETIDTNKCVLEFTAVIDGITINGVDMIEINDEGQIISFKVMVRPLQGMNKLHQKMGEMLKKMIRLKAKSEFKRFTNSPIIFLKEKLKR